ncbi:MAG: hypothetical protein HY097_04650 [Nitrospinae bacterium]|nr:hypothetical protein [Nitrospinota bacterium]MBI3814872.1 hypothetical protein [Nitrospinota bacterium]
MTILSRDERDFLFKRKWEGLKEELEKGNIEKALEYIVSNSRDMHRYNFELMSSIMPAIAQDMGNIIMVKIEDDAAEYEITSACSGHTMSFYVKFVKDADGVWRIRFY